MQYSAEKLGFTVDELGFIQIASAKILTAVVRGTIDLNLLAREELASRGVDHGGKWVGFKEARKILGLTKK